MKYSHIIWTSYLTWLPHEKRGKWDSLIKLYSSLSEKFEVKFSKSLCNIYNNEIQNNRVVFSASDIKNLKDSILELSRNDRISGDLDILAIDINSTEVQILVKGEFEEIKQKISRLKSRSATELSFTYKDKINESAKHTWSKGIWVSEFNEHEDVFKISSYISNHCT
ncbi:hypothetical protein MNBD_GAMMA12-2128 [hydrothermal vent metagenome]|uniref:Transposase IS200-like domain-containing protein n=1 Tax=hydrothermal vent metagenome TaxID=652676 RepID=A0A3B0Y4N4_9ZZZZ